MVLEFLKTSRAYSLNEFIKKAEESGATRVVVKPLIKLIEGVFMFDSFDHYYSTRFEAEIEGGRRIVYNERYGPHTTVGLRTSRENGLRHFTTLDNRLKEIKERLPSVDVKVFDWGGKGELSEEDYQELGVKTKETGSTRFKKLGLVESLSEYFAYLG